MPDNPCVRDPPHRDPLHRDPRNRDPRNQDPRNRDPRNCLGRGQTVVRSPSYIDRNAIPRSNQVGETGLKFLEGSACNFVQAHAGETA